MESVLASIFTWAPFSNSGPLQRVYLLSHLSRTILGKVLFDWKDLVEFSEHTLSLCVCVCLLVNIHCLSLCVCARAFACTHSCACVVCVCVKTNADSLVK